MPEKRDTSVEPPVTLALSLSAIPNPPLVDHGDEVQIDLYIHGFGEVVRHHLVVHMPPGLCDGPVRIRSFRFASSPALQYPVPIFPQQENERSEHFGITFSQHYFELNQAGHLFASGPVIHAETNTQYAPLSLAFRVSRESPSGEHEIPIRLAYQGPGGGGVCESNPKIVVRSFGQRYQTFLTTLVAVITVAVPILVSQLPPELHPWAWSLGGLAVVPLLLLLRRR